jgi:hypothetical protein
VPGLRGWKRYSGGLSGDNIGHHSLYSSARRSLYFGLHSDNAMTDGQRFVDRLPRKTRFYDSHERRAYELTRAVAGLLTLPTSSATPFPTWSGI